MWVVFNDELTVKASYRRQANLQKEEIRLIRYILQWAYKRNKTRIFFIGYGDRRKNC